MNHNIFGSHWVSETPSIPIFSDLWTDLMQPVQNKDGKMTIAVVRASLSSSPSP